MSVISGDRLPSSWTWVTLDSIASGIQYGHTESANQEPVGPKFLRITDIQDGSVAWNEVPYCVASPEEIGRYTLKQGDIVFARTGATTGKSYLIRNCPAAVFASYLIRVRTEQDAVWPQYLALYFQSPWYWSQIAAERKGSAQPGVNATILAQLRVPVAPLNEQRRIVAEIEKQFSRLDAAVTALKRMQSNLKRYRASVLQAACQGRLVLTEAELARAEGRGYETASELLGRIAESRKRQVRKAPEPISPEFTPSALPEGWEWASLDELLVSIRNGLSAKPDADDGVAILRISAVRPRQVNTADIRFLNADLTSVSGYLLETGDLLFTRYNGNPEFVGVCGAVGSLGRPTTHPDKLIRGQVVSTEVSPQYLELVLNVGRTRTFIRSRVRTTAGQAGVSGGDLKETPVPVAPAAEQRRIAAEADRQLSIIDELERITQANLKRAERLRQSILKRAFEGKLVPQDAADEPASVLLERIRTERAAADNGKPARNGRGRKSAGGQSAVELAE